MRERKEESTEKATTGMIDTTHAIDRAIQTRGRRKNMTKAALRRANAAGTATGLISFIHSGFRTDDIGGNHATFPPANLRRQRCIFLQTDGVASTVALASRGTRHPLPPAGPICKTGEAAGSERRFGKKFPGARLDFPRGPGAIRDPSGIRIPQVAAMRAVATTLRGQGGRPCAENHLATELQNAIRLTPPSGEREEQQ